MAATAPAIIAEIKIAGALPRAAKSVEALSAQTSTGLFAEEERRNRRSKLGDPLVGLSKHVDFGALGDEIDIVVPRPSRAKGGRPPYPPS